MTHNYRIVRRIHMQCSPGILFAVLLSGEERFAGVWTLQWAASFGFSV
jgi:hypothetical protein